MVTCSLDSVTTTLSATTEGVQVIHAAGGIVVRRDDDGVRVAVVWRSERGDWTFPKGKLDSGETYEQAACREVEEETGLVCTALRFVGTTEYQHRKGRPKVVAYFLMTPTSGSFTPNEEVDELSWCTVLEAERLLTWDRDRDLLARASQLPELADER
jgi:8-oxo-dGTP pyrophosphatase MutT (NUDIX family)